MKKAKLKNLAQGDLQAISDIMGGLLDKQAAVLRLDLASKQDMKESEYRIKTELKDYVHQGVETIMSGMDGLSEQMAEKQTVEDLKKWAVKTGYKADLNG